MSQSGSKHLAELHGVTTRTTVENQRNGKLLTAKEFARLRGVHIRTVWRWIRRGDLIPLRLPSGTPRFQLEILISLREK